MSGDLPSGWREAQLGEVARIVTGKTPSTKEPRYWGGDIPFVTPSDITDSPWLRQVERHVSSDGMRYSSVVPAGSVLFTCIASIGKSCITREVSTLNQQINACVPSAKVDAYFLYNALQARVGDMLDLAGTTAVPIINKTTFSKVAVKLPPLDEQRRIAEVLRSVDEAIALSKKTVEQVENASRGLLQRLFVEGLGHSDFKEGYSSQIPASWKEMSLSELSAIPITYGVVQPGPNVPNGIRFIRGGDFPGGKIDLGALRTISPELASQYRRTQLEGGEVLVSLVGYPGACAVVPKELAGANVNRAVAVMRPTQAVTSAYLYHFISSPVAQVRLKKETIGSAQQVINLRDLKGVIVPVPPKHEQEQIAAILGDLDDFAELEQLSLDKLTTLRASIAADLLSGRVRVPA